MADITQNYANHRRIVPGFHMAVGGTLIGNVLWSIVAFFLSFGGGFWSVINALVGIATACALVGLGLYARSFAVTAQDRIIRLEMRLRLAEILPPDLKARIGELSHGQFVGLRFASDAEMPELVRAVLDEKITDRDAIKQRVKDWQPDHLRV